MNRTRRLLPVLLAAGLLVVSGCKSKIDNAPVSADKARETLKTALESWKKGDKHDALQAHSPPIYVIDNDWQSGAALKDYQLLGADEEMDAHLFCKARLTVKESNGKESTREVTYVISTAPNLTVSRKLF